MTYLLTIHTNINSNELEKNYFWLKTNKNKLPKGDFIWVSETLTGENDICINRNCILYYVSMKIKG